MTNREHYFLKCKELEKENEQLKQSHKEIFRDLEVTTFDKELLQKENEQLKQQNKKLKEELEWCRITVDGLKGDV